jgi:hypothetical protein
MTLPLSRLFTCRKCKLFIMVPADDTSGHLLKKRMRCPNWVTCKSSIYENATTNIAPVGGQTHLLSAIQLYQSTMGTGLPEERNCGPKDIKKLMTGAKITAVQLGDAPTANRSLIHSITLDNGKVLHLAPSTKGATIFKVTEDRHGR